MTDHMELVRAAYEQTKADHAWADGCDEDGCDRGLDPARIRGWDYDLDRNRLLCPDCASERRRMKAIEAAKGKRTRCVNDHDLTADGALYANESRATGRLVWRCRQCRRDRSAANKRRRRDRAEREAARA